MAARKRRSGARSSAQVAAQKKAAAASAAKRKKAAGSSNVTKVQFGGPKSTATWNKRQESLAPSTLMKKYKGALKGISTARTAAGRAHSEKKAETYWNAYQKAKKATQGTKIKTKLTPSQKHGSGTGLTSAHRYLPSNVKKRGGS